MLIEIEIAVAGTGSNKWEGQMNRHKQYRTQMQHTLCRIHSSRIDKAYISSTKRKMYYIALRYIFLVKCK